jgi:hypothetical protein
VCIREKYCGALSINRRWRRSLFIRYASSSGSFCKPHPVALE